MTSDDTTRARGRRRSAVLAASPSDPVGWNNLGNVQLGLGRFEEALGSLDRAVALGGADYAFAAANHALANFELGRTNAAVKELRTLLRRFPEFPEVRPSCACACVCVWGCMLVCMRDVKEVHTTVCRQLPSACLCEEKGFIGRTRGK